MRKIIFFILLIRSFSNAEDFFRLKEKIVKDYRFHLFGFYVKPVFSINNAGFNSNIYNYEVYETPDWVAEPALNLRLSTIFSDRLILSFTAQPSYLFYLRHSKESAWNQQYDLDIHTYIGSINLHGKLYNRDQKTYPTAEFGIRIHQYERGGNLMLEMGRQDSLFLSLALQQRRFSFKDENYLNKYNLPQLLNHREDGLDFRINKIIFTQTKLSIAFVYEQYRFDHSPERDADSRKYIVGLQFPGFGGLAGGFSFGFREFIPKNTGYKTLRKPTGQGSLSLRLLGRWHLKGEYLYDNYYSFFAANSYYINRSIGGGLEYYFFRWFKAGFFHRNIKFQTRSFETDSDVQRGNLQQNTFSVGIRIKRSTGLVISYIHYSGNSTDMLFNRKYSFIGGTISNEF